MLATRYPATLRGVSETLIITRPAGKTLAHDQIAELPPGNHPGHLSRYGETCEITAKLTCPLDAPAAVVYHASWADQKIVRGTIADIAHKARDEGIEHTALLIVGRVVDPEEGVYEVLSLLMNDTVVIALSRFKGEAEKVAKFLGADVRIYPDNICEDFSSHQADRSDYVDGNCCTQDCSPCQ